MKMLTIKNLLLATAAALSLAACNTELGPEYSTLPAFGEVSYTPALVTPENTVSVSVAITSQYGLQRAWIAYFLNDDELNIKTTAPYFYTKAHTSVTFKGTLPKQVAGTKVTFRVVAATPYDVLDGSQIHSYTVTETTEEKPVEK